MFMSINVKTNEYLTFARQLARGVGQSLKLAAGRSRASLKGDGSLVTTADQETDRALAAAIRQRFPHHGVISEEQATVYHGQPFCWVVDPIDGTTNFAQGLAIWGISIALLHKGWPLLGVLEFPMLNQQYHAVRDRGVFLGQDQLHVREPSVHKQTEFLTICSRTRRYFEVTLPYKVRALGCVAYHLASVASGSVTVSVEASPKIWDLAAGWLMIQEAGGVVGSLLDDSPLPFPLVAGRDYARRPFPLLSAASQETWANAHEGLALKQKGENMVNELRKQEWLLP
jgi:myo-inositol-1(or 4)-monophosphatase